MEEDLPITAKQIIQSLYDTIDSLHVAIAQKKKIIDKYGEVVKTQEERIINQESLIKALEQIVKEQESLIAIYKQKDNKEQPGFGPVPDLLPEDIQ